MLADKKSTRIETRLRVIMDDYAEERSSEVRAELHRLRRDLECEKAFAHSAQTHAAELEIENKRLIKTLGDVVEFLKLRRDVAGIEERMYNNLLEVVK